MKRSQLVVLMLFVMIVGVLFAVQAPPASANGSLKPNLQGTPSGDDISIDPVSTQPATPPPVATGKPPVGTKPLNPPATLEDLLKQYPDLQAYLDKIKDMKIGDMDMAELYKRIIQIYKDKGASGVAAFLKDSGILEKFNIPLSYLDLLVVYDSGGMDAVVKLAKDRKLINKDNEILGYLTIDDPANLGAVTEALKGLGVSVYRFDENTDEVQIGIPLSVLSQYQTPGALLGYLGQIGNVPHVVGFRAPTPMTTSGLGLKPALEVDWAKRIGADKWHAAGITGKGVKLGIMDGGFGHIKEYLGKELPATVTTNLPIDDLDAMEEIHGTAVSIVAHGIAPEADMYIAAVDLNDGQSIEDALKFFVDNQVKVINFSAGGSVGPRDGTYGWSVGFEQFVQQTGILFVNAAGNEGFSHTMFKFRDNGKGVHTFDANDPGINVVPFVCGAPQTDVIMNWNGNWQGKEKDEFDIVIIDKDGNEVARGAEPKKGKKGDLPFQVAVFDSTPGEVYGMAFLKAKNAKADHVLDVFAPNCRLADEVQVPAYSVGTPGDASSIFAVGAVGIAKDDLESYSSQGPTTDGRIKPDVVAPAGEDVPPYNQGADAGPFNGTSASSPVVAGAAALVFQKFPDMTEAEVRAFLIAHVKDLGKKGEDPQFGAGRISLGDPGKVDAEDPSANTDPEATPEPDQGEPTATPTAAAANPDAPVATIKDTSAKFNQTYKGKKGLKVSVSFDVDNFKGKKGVVALLFFDTATGQQVPTDDENYTVLKGLGTGAAFQSKTASSSFDNVSLFIPNSAFSKLGSGTKDLYYVILVADVTDPNNVTIIGASDKVPIKFKK